MAHTIGTYRAHLVTLKRTLTRESDLMHAIQRFVTPQTDTMLMHLSELIDRSRMHSVDYATIDDQYRRYCTEELKPFTNRLRTIRDRVHKAVKSIETAHHELSADFAHLSPKLPRALGEAHKRAGEDLSIVSKDERFVEKVEREEERMLRRMEQLIDGFILRDIARAERHHRPDDTPLDSDIKALQETSRKVQGFSNLICEKARLARVHLDDAIDDIGQEIEGVEKIVELTQHKDPFLQSKRAA